MGKKQAAKMPEDKNGRPSGLARFRKECPLATRIVPLPSPNGYPSFDELWFGTYSAFLIDEFRNGTTTLNTLAIPPALQAHVKNRLHDLEPTPVCRWFEPPDNKTLTQPFPKLRLVGPPWERALRTSNALYRVALRYPYLVREAALGYCWAATTRRRIVLTDDADAVYGRVLIRCIKKLRVPGLKVKLVGFTIGEVIPNLDHWKDRLGLRRRITPEYEPASNQAHKAALDYAGLKITWGGSALPSREWHEVILVASVIELWRAKV
jgi:hypothetical protein